MIGDRLKEVRKDRGDTQAELARKMNVSLSTVKSWEGEKSAPNHELLVRICRLYNVSADFLLGLTDMDPFFLRQSQRKLPPEKQKQLQYFEQFLHYTELMNE